MIKIGVVGCGGIAQVMHLPYLTGTEGGGVPGIEVVAVCDVLKELAEAVAERYHIKEAYTDHKDMLNKSDIDAVAVLTRHETHAEISIDAMNQGKHVFVEKPMCETIKDAEKMIETQRKSNVTLQVGYMKRFDSGYHIALEEFKKMKDIIHIRAHKYFPMQGTGAALQEAEILRQGLGKNGLEFQVSEEMSKQLQARRDHMIREQFGDEATEEETAAYFGLLSTSGHVVNALQGFFGDPKSVLRTEIRKAGAFVTSLLDYGDSLCIFEFGRTQQRWWDEGIIAYSPTKIVEINFSNSHLKNRPAKVRVIEGSEKTVETTMTGSYSESFRDEWDNFVKCTLTGARPVASGEDGKRVIEICVAMIENYRSKQPVRV
jgi:predicted dehydrogenase